MSPEPRHPDSDNLQERLRAQAQVLHDLQLAQARFIEKYRDKLAQTSPSNPSSERARPE